MQDAGPAGREIVRPFVTLFGYALLSLHLFQPQQPQCMRFFTTLILLFFSLGLSAQVTLEGQLIDGESEEPIGFANVAVYDETDELRAGATTDMDGRYIIQLNTGGQYRIEATYIGYETVRESVQLAENSPSPGPRVTALYPSGAMDLEEVTVTAERAVMELGLDRKTFNVEKSIAASGGSAEDLLRQIPSITLDLDGNVSLRGSGNVRFLINGKPSGLVGDDPVTFLRGLSATNIEKVEVITNPGAAFDPDGTAGLINIVLKRKRDDGFNATVNLNAGTNNKFDGALDLNWRKGKFNSFAGVSGRYDERWFRGFRDQEGVIADSSFSRFFTFDGDRTNRSMLYKLGTEYALTKRASVGLQGNVQFQRGNNNNQRVTRFFNSAAEQDRLSNRDETDEGEETEYEVRLNYDQRFAREDRRLSFSAQYSGETESEVETYLEELTFATLPPEFINQRSPDAQDESQFLTQLDYKQDFGPLTFETGTRITLRDQRQDAAFQDAFGTGEFVTIDSLSNLFDYQEDVYALYASLGGTFDKLTVSGGLRAEQAYTTSTLLEPTGEVFTNDYFKVYPSLFLGYAFDDNTTVQASYSRRINRPRAWALNPFIDRGDPFNLRSGNPFLLPELINSYEVNVQQRYGVGSLTAGLYYRQQNDLITRITRVLDGGVSLNTRDNLDRGREYGLELIATLRAGEKLNLTASGNAYRSELLGTLNEEEVDQNGYLFSGNLQGTYQLPWGIESQFTYFYRSPGIRPQGEIRTIQSFDLGFRKDVLNKRGVITLRATDIFNTRRYRFLTETGGLVTNSEFQRESRIVYLGFQYSLQEIKPQRGGRGGRGGGGGGGDDDF